MLACILLANLYGVANAEEDVVQQARALVDEGNAAQAYRLLEPLEEQRGGDPEFDYLLGVSALDSGQPGRAVFALERVLAVNPNHTLARAEIARAYLLLGEQQTAKQEFENVLKENPPELVTQSINQYLAAIEKTLTDRTRFAAFLEFGLGHDSNINTATGSQSVAVPAFGGLLFTLDPTATKQSDNFSNLAAGINFRHPFSSNVSLFGGVTGNEHFNWKREQFDTETIDANLGMSIKNHHDVYTVALQDNHFDLNSEGYRHAYGVTGQWQRTLDNSNQISAFVQASRLSYDKQSLRDADRYVAGVEYGHAFTGDYLPVLFVSGYVGTEDERASGVSFLGNRLAGVRAGGQLTYNPKTIIFGSASYEHRNYGGQEPIWLVSRDDDQYDLSLGVRYTPSSFWSVRPQVSYTHNNSNVPIDDYNRYTVSVTVRRDFNW